MLPLNLDGYSRSCPNKLPTRCDCQFLPLCLLTPKINSSRETWADSSHCVVPSLLTFKKQEKITDTIIRANYFYSNYGGNNYHTTTVRKMTSHFFMSNILILQFLYFGVACLLLGKPQQQSRPHSQDTVWSSVQLASVRNGTYIVMDGVHVMFLGDLEKYVFSFILPR